MKRGELIRFLGGYKNYYNKLKDIKRNDPCINFTIIYFTILIVLLWLLTIKEQL